MFLMFRKCFISHVQELFHQNKDNKTAMEVIVLWNV